MKKLLSPLRFAVAMILLAATATTSAPPKTSSALAANTKLTSKKQERDSGDVVRKFANGSAPTSESSSDTRSPADDSNKRTAGGIAPPSMPDQPSSKDEASTTPTQTTSIEVALVANSQDATVALVDVNSRSLLGTIDVNPARVKSEGPGAPNYAQDTDVSPDGKTLYVSRGYVGDVAAFDIVSGRLLWKRSLDTKRADHMTIAKDGKSLFVSALMDNRVYRVATDTGEITGHLVTGIYPHDNKVSKDGGRLYNTSIGPIGTLPRQTGNASTSETPGYPFQLTIANPDTLETIERIRLDKPFRPWQFTPDEKGIYAQLSNEHAVIAYDLQLRKIVKRLDLPVKPGVTAADWDFDAPHHGLALTPDGSTLCLAARASDYAALVKAPDLTVITTIPVGDAPGWAEVADNGRVCLVANTRSNDLSIISIQDRKEIVRLPIGKGPKHITVARIPMAVISALRARH